jgi:hypothetical protein
MTGSSLAVPDEEECVWTIGALFRGWQAVEGGVTGYWRYLHEVAEMRRVGGGSNGG